MSFSGDVKNELCRVKNQKPCCARAQLYGMLLYFSALSFGELRLITSCRKIVRLLPALCEEVCGQKADFKITGDKGHFSISLTDPEQVKRLLETFDYDARSGAVWHLNGWHLTEDCCRNAFLRGAFLAGGYISEPEKGYAMELTNIHGTLTREMMSLLGEMSFSPGYVKRRDEYVLYYKDVESISAMLAKMGAANSVLRLMEARTIRETRNKINRKVNCEAANIMKTADSAARQLAAIERLRASPIWQDLPEELKQTAMLREAHPYAALAELSACSEPPITKSGLNHRLSRLLSISDGLSESGKQTEKD